MSNAYFLIPVKVTSKVALVWEFTFMQESSGNSVNHQCEGRDLAYILLNLYLHWL